MPEYCYIKDILARREVFQIPTTQTQIVFSPHVNGYGRLFGGQLMAWIDIVAAVEARRHCRHNVTTACVDRLTFLKPAMVDDMLILEAEVTWTGNTSLEVRVDTYVESLSGERDLVNTAFLVFVAIDENNQPVKVEEFVPQTQKQRQEWERAQKRRERRMEG